MNSLNELLRELRPAVPAQALVPGNVVSFHYSLFRHDPYPVTLILEDQGPYLFGINLHYLSFPLVQQIFQRYGQAPTYEAVRNMGNIDHAFRRYKKAAITQPRAERLTQILQKMLMVRRYPEHEIQNAVEDVRQQREGQVPPAPVGQQTPEI